MEILYSVLGWIMDACYELIPNYAVAIILFTVVSKIILLPVSIWTHFNSIKIIKIQPEINMLKVKYYGQKDIIAEEEAKLQKRQGYNPLLSTIPMFIQLILLMGVVEVIKRGMTDPLINMNVFGVSLGVVPSEMGIKFLWAPIVAGLSSWILCVAQNVANVLQAEQSKANKYGMMFFSVGLSVYLGWFVSVGTVLYWVASNLLAVVQQYILNAVISPKRYVDYEKLKKSREELAKIQSVGKTKRDKQYYINKKREKRDYKRFFSVINKHLVFYSESNGFYKYYKGFIEYILQNSNVTIHYITSDPNDNIFNIAQTNPRIRAYYIGENRLITLMMRMDADVVVMTMPDIQNYHIKRSYVRKDIEYVYVQHGIGSISLTMRKGCVDHYDSIFCAGVHQKTEVQQTERVYNLPKKILVEVGYPLIDELRSAYEAEEHAENERKKILIAPSWQSENIIDSCLETILDKLKGKNYEIIVRPHPQEVRLKQDYMDVLKKKYTSENVEIQTDFSSNNPIQQADLLITDWSDISCEFAFSTLKPVLFINTPMKIMNPEYQKIPTEPINIALRDKVGKNLDMDKLDLLPETVEYLLTHTQQYREQIDHVSDMYLYNHGTSSTVGGKYIIEAMQRQIIRKKQKT